MGFLTKISIILWVWLLCGFNHKSNPHHLNIKLNYGNAELLLRWFDDLSNRKIIDSISDEPGSQVMEDNVRLSSDSQSSLKTFREEMNSFSAADTTDDSYGIRLAFQMRKGSLSLLQKLREKQIRDAIIRRALFYIPGDYPINTTCTIYFVLTGWQWGDAYVCNIKQQGKRFTIADDGEPSIVINLSLISKLYGKTADEQLGVLNGILSHEIFHFVFANYKRKSPLYNLHRDTSVLGRLLDVIQNEGIAHYVDKKALLIKDYGKDPKYAQAEIQNMNTLNDSFVQLMSNDLGESQKRELLRKANTGKYWTKYGSIAGMFMAYHIEKEKGESALRECIQQGPSYLIEQYANLSQVKNDLPRLCDALKSYAEKNLKKR